MSFSSSLHHNAVEVLSCVGHIFRCMSLAIRFVFQKQLSATSLASERLETQQRSSVSECIYSARVSTGDLSYPLLVAPTAARAGTLEHSLFKSSLSASGHLRLHGEFCVILSTMCANMQIYSQAEANNANKSFEAYCLLPASLWCDPTEAPRGDLFLTCPLSAALWLWLDTTSSSLLVLPVGMSPERAQTEAYQPPDSMLARLLSSEQRGALNRIFQDLKLDHRRQKCSVADIADGSQSIRVRIAPLSDSTQETRHSRGILLVLSETNAALNFNEIRQNAISELCSVHAQCTSQTIFAWTQQRQSFTEVLRRIRMSNEQFLGDHARALESLNIQVQTARDDGASQCAALQVAFDAKSAIAQREAQQAIDALHAQKADLECAASSAADVNAKLSRQIDRLCLENKVLLKRKELVFLARTEILNDVARVCCLPVSVSASGGLVSAIPLREVAELALAWISSVPTSDAPTGATLHTGVLVHLWAVENEMLRNLRTAFAGCATEHCISSPSEPIMRMVEHLQSQHGDTTFATMAAAKSLHFGFLLRTTDQEDESIIFVHIAAHGDGDSLPQLSPFLIQLRTSLNAAALHVSAIQCLERTLRDELQLTRSSREQATSLSETLELKRNEGLSLFELFRQQLDSFSGALSPHTVQVLLHSFMPNVESRTEANSGEDEIDQAFLASSRHQMLSSIASRCQFFNQLPFLLNPHDSVAAKATRACTILANMFSSPGMRTTIRILLSVSDFLLQGDESARTVTIAHEATRKSFEFVEFRSADALDASALENSCAQSSLASHDLVVSAGSASASMLCAHIQSNGLDPTRTSNTVMVVALPFLASSQDRVTGLLVMTRRLDTGFSNETVQYEFHPYHSDLLRAPCLDSFVPTDSSTLQAAYRACQLSNPLCVSAKTLAPHPYLSESDWDSFFAGGQLCAASLSHALAQDSLCRANVSRLAQVNDLEKKFNLVLSNLADMNLVCEHSSLLSSCHNVSASVELTRQTLQARFPQCEVRIFSEPSDSRFSAHFSESGQRSAEIFITDSTSVSSSLKDLARCDVLVCPIHTDPSTEDPSASEKTAHHFNNQPLRGIIEVVSASLTSSTGTVDGSVSQSTFSPWDIGILQHISRNLCVSLVRISVSESFQRAISDVHAMLRAATAEELARRSECSQLSEQVALTQQALALLREHAVVVEQNLLSTTTQLESCSSSLRESSEERARLQSDLDAVTAELDASRADRAQAHTALHNLSRKLETWISAEKFLTTTQELRDELLRVQLENQALVKMLNDLVGAYQSQ